jgi:hypothetical protein
MTTTGRQKSAYNGAVRLEIVRNMCFLLILKHAAYQRITCTTYDQISTSSYAQQRKHRSLKPPYPLSRPQHASTSSTMDRELQTLGIDSRVDRLLVLVLGIVYQLWPLSPCSVDETGRITRLRRLAIYDWHQEFDAKVEILHFSALSARAPLPVICARATQVGKDTVGVRAVQKKSIIPLRTQTQGI